MEPCLKQTLFVIGLAGLVAAFAPSQAEAQQLASCGGIYLSSDTTCEIQVEGGCMAMCEPINFTATCSADLYVECEGMCDASFEASCTADCSADCMASCEVDPGMFDCQADCTADIGARCEAQCSAEADGSQAEAECEASCETTFRAECDASCDATPPMADCMASCQASCEGSCTAEANVDCQVDCQAGGYVDCETMLTGGCEASCMEPTGGLFCDGQYVDASSLEMCIAEIQSSLDITVDRSASAMCDETGCEATAEASASCSATPGRTGDAGWLALLALPVVALFRRRR
jgi:hypothetical protein